MSNSVTRSITITLSIALAVLFVRFLAMSADSVGTVMGTSIKQEQKAADHLRDDSVRRYEGMEITGSEVPEMIRLMYDDGGLLLVEKSSGVYEAYVFSNKSLTEFTDSGSLPAMLKRAKHNINGDTIYKAGVITDGKTDAVIGLELHIAG